MDNPDRRLIEEIFERILERPPNEWDLAVVELCGGEEPLEREVGRLVAAHRRSEGLLERPFTVRPGSTRGSVDSLINERVGSYLILQEIGKGGMGRVYLADRADGHFKRRVAVKVIHDTDPDLQARVVAERQILASLEHPNIGRLLDGGVTSDGRPFLAMEYVNGLPIDLYCDRMRLSIRERLRLFLTVLDAVEHAHRNLVVHRDLKPSNILVTPSGEVKLLDFGIAKILNPGLGGVSSPLTLAGDRALTPEYASPEQVRGEAITTSADIYSLGIVLFRILTGRGPYDSSQGSLPELVKAVCEDDPPLPSQIVSLSRRQDGQGGLGEEVRDSAIADPVELARARHTTSGRLGAQLKGDIDAIVMKCLRKEPVRRYKSVEVLSKDIQNFLAALPVEASRGKRWYRLRKFVRRHQGGAVAAALVTLSLVGGAGVAAWQAREASQERDRATAALRESEEGTDFLLGLFQSSDPTESPGDEVTALDLLARGASRAGELQEEPLVQARMLQVMAEANLNLGRYQEGEELARQGLELLVDELGREHEEVAEGMVGFAMALTRGGRYDSAWAVLEEAREIQERLLGPDALELSTTLEIQAGVDVYLGEVVEAERRARASLAIRERTLGTDAPATLDILRSVSGILRFQGRYQEAETGFREVLRRRRKLVNPDPLTLSTDLLQVGSMVMARGGDLEEAERLSREALALQEPGTGVVTTNRVWALTSLSKVLLAKGDLAGAEELLDQSLEERRRTFGDLHPLVAESLGELGSFYAEVGRLAEAEAATRRALEITLETAGPQHTRYAGSLTWLAGVLFRKAEFEEADSLTTQALEIRGRALGTRTAVYAETLAILAEIRTARGMYESADSLLGLALKALPDHVEGATVPRRIHGALADLYEATGRDEESARHRALAASGS